MTKPTVPTDYSPEQLEDMRQARVADRMIEALTEYRFNVRAALGASLVDGSLDAHGFRADAKAALHAFPELLSLVEGTT